MFGRWSVRGVVGLVLLGAVLLAGACKDDPASPKVIPGGGDPLVLKDLPAGIHPVLSAPGWSSMKRGGPIHTSVHLVAVALESKIASYQGEIRFDRGAVELKDVTVPEGIMAVWNETEPGVIRFAGVALEGLGNQPILLFDLEADGPIRASAFQVTVEEVVAAEDFVNLTDRVVEQEVPVLTGERVAGR